MKDKVMNWVKNANGWQRLWLVSSIAIFMYGLLWWPLSTVGSMSYSYYFEVEKDYKNPACVDYFTKPINQLIEPPYSLENRDTCWHVYNTRKYQSTDVLPFTPDTYLDDLGQKHRSRLYEHMTLGSIIAIVGAALLYFLGSIVNWVIQGFNKSNS